MRRNIKIMIAAAAAVGTVAVAGISYAAFARSADGTASGGSEEFNNLTVAGQWVGGTASPNLLPGEAGAVKLTIGAPGDNSVNAEVVSITPNPITAGDIGGDVTGGDKATCAAWLSAQTFTPAAGTVVLDKNATNVQVTLNSAVTFSVDATEVCEGMTFSTKWKVRFQATRAAATLGSNNTVALPL
jgi:hypothetical protein